MKDSLNIAIAGATGYVGLELIKILSKHPKVKILYLCANKSVGSRIYTFDKKITKKNLPKISRFNNIDWKKINLQIAIFRPLTAVKRENEFDVRCSVKGGGLTGQAGAIILGISRAIILFEPDLKPTLKKEKLTTRDSRGVERKKYGRRKARRSFQFSKR